MSIDSKISVDTHHLYAVFARKNVAFHIDDRDVVVYDDSVCHRPDRTCPDVYYDKAYAWNRVFHHAYHILYIRIPYADDHDEIYHSVSDPDNQNTLCHGDCNDVYAHDALPTDDYEHTSTHVVDDGSVEYGVGVF